MTSVAMNLHQRIHQVASQDGILAVFAHRARGENTFVGDEAYRRLAEQAARAQSASPVPMIRVNAGSQAIFVSGDEDVAIAIVFAKAHPVVKSVKRTIHQLVRKDQRERLNRVATFTPTRTPSRPPSAPPAAVSRAWPM
jgi:hypothetical protein